MLKSSNKRGGVGCGLTRIPTIIIEEGDENLDHNSSPNMVLLSSHIWIVKFMIKPYHPIKKESTILNELHKNTTIHMDP